MKIKSSLGYQDTITLKEILTRKYTTLQQSSEKMFGIISQPGNTCPIIDKAKFSISYEIDRAKSCLKDLDYWNGRSCYEEECCNSSGLFEDNSKLINDYISNLENIMSNLTEINEMLEDLRSDAEELRNVGTSIKEGIWSIIADRENLEEVRTELEEYLNYGVRNLTEKFNYTYVRNNFKAMDNSTPRLDDGYCKNRCESYLKNSQLVEAFNNISSVDINEPSEIEKAIENKDKIYYWVDELIEFLKSLLVDEELLAYSLREEQNLYLQALNDTQSEKFSKFIKNLHLNPLKFVEKTSVWEHYKTQEENLLTVKKIESEIDLMNQTIQEYNELYKTWSGDQYQQATSYFQQLYIKLSGLNPNWDKSLATIQESYLRSKNQLMRQLESVAPQTFTED